MKMKSRRRLGKAAEEHGHISGMVIERKLTKTWCNKSRKRYSHGHQLWRRNWGNIYHVLAASYEWRITPFPCHPPSLQLIVNNWFYKKRIISIYSSSFRLEEQRCNASQVPAPRSLLQSVIHHSRHHSKFIMTIGQSLHKNKYSQ